MKATNDRRPLQRQFLPALSLPNTCKHVAKVVILSKVRRA